MTNLHTKVQKELEKYLVKDIKVLYKDLGIHYNSSNTKKNQCKYLSKYLIKNKSHPKVKAAIHKLSQKSVIHKGGYTDQELSECVKYKQQQALKAGRPKPPKKLKSLCNEVLKENDEKAEKDVLSNCEPIINGLEKIVKDVDLTRRAYDDAPDVYQQLKYIGFFSDNPGDKEEWRKLCNRIENLDETSQINLLHSIQKILGIY